MRREVGDSLVFNACGRCRLCPLSGRVGLVRVHFIEDGEIELAGVLWVRRRCLCLLLLFQLSSTGAARLIGVVEISKHPRRFAGLLTVSNLRFEGHGYKMWFSLRNRLNAFSVQAVSGGWIGTGACRAASREAAGGCAS
jgi:hypothetical protein